MHKFLSIYAKILRKLRGSSFTNSKIGYDSKVEAGSNVVGSSMLNHSYIGYDSTIINTDIGSFCSIGDRVSIGGAMHPMHFVSTSPVFLSHRDSVKVKYARHDFLPIIKTKIGHDVWIGQGAFIKSGISIGIGAVVGMGAVVTKNVPAYAIVGGNPAKVIRYRFNDEVIEQLLATEWWFFSEIQLRKYAHLFNNPEQFLTSFSEEEN
jgi:acetyltransferase-like isoleucine patch superfamily enzyme|tara:strand:- start:1108 stop:1728 length:621 start_codon:yes stop_codon:yes gene_type:complete